MTHEFIMFTLMLESLNKVRVEGLADFNEKEMSLALIRLNQWEPPGETTGGKKYCLNFLMKSH